MKVLLVCIALLLNFELPAQHGINGNSPADQVITEDMIKSAGITSLSEILTLVHGLNYSSIDGSTLAFSLNNLSNYQRQNVLIMLDGQKADIGIFDVLNINLLPVSIDQIDYVEIIPLPHIYKGIFAPGGVIHFHTKIPDEGLSVQAMHTLGDETGDPGPFAFTEYESPNVDKLAQFFAFNLNASGDNWYMKGSLKHEEGFESDPAVNDRISFLNGDDNKTRLIAYRYKLNANLLSGNQQLTASITNNNDFFFFKPYGNEIPVKQTLRQFSYTGNSEMQNAGLNYYANYSVHELGYLNNFQNINFDFGVQNVSLGMEAFYRIKSLKAAFGIGNSRNTAVTSVEMPDKNVAVRNFYLTADFTPAQSLAQTAGVYLARSNNENSLKGFLQTNWEISHKHLLSSNFSFVQTLLNEENNYLTWLKKGYRFSPAEYNLQSIPDTKKLLSADLFYKFIFDSAAYVLAGLNFRQFSDLYIEKQYFQYNDSTSTFNSLPELKTDERLKSAGASISFHYRFNSSVLTSFSYNYSRSLSGTVLAKDNWLSFPEHNFMININYSPFKDVGLSVRLKYFSVTKWFEYKYISDQSAQKYAMEIEPEVLLDASVYTWLWKRKVWINAAFKNLLNNPEKYHPLGADLDFRIYVQVHFYFNSILK